MITTAPEVDTLIDAGAPIVICVSGGKDSRLAAEQAVAYARSRNHTERSCWCMPTEPGGLVGRAATMQATGRQVGC